MAGVSSGSKPYRSKTVRMVLKIKALLLTVSAAKSRVPCGNDGFDITGAKKQD